jgi:hypothetical protein
LLRDTRENRTDWEWEGAGKGKHTIKLVVVDGNGGRDEYSMSIEVGSEGGGQCFIATAAYGTRAAAEVELLRELRDKVLMQNMAGQAFVRLYYRISPPLAGFISSHGVLRTLVRELVIEPVVTALDITSGLWSN